MVGGNDGLYDISFRFTSISSRTLEFMGVRSAIDVIYGWHTCALSMSRRLTYSIMFLAVRGEHKGVVMHCYSAWLPQTQIKACSWMSSTNRSKVQGDSSTTQVLLMHALLFRFVLCFFWLPYSCWSSLCRLNQKRCGVCAFQPCALRSLVTGSACRLDPLAGRSSLVDRHVGGSRVRTMA